MTTDETLDSPPEVAGDGTPPSPVQSTDWGNAMGCYIAWGLAAVYLGCGSFASKALQDQSWAEHEAAWDGLVKTIARGAVRTGDSLRRALALATVPVANPPARALQQRAIMGILGAMQSGVDGADTVSLREIVYRYVADLLTHTQPDRMPAADLHECTRALVRWGYLNVVAAARHAGCGEDILGAALMSTDSRSPQWVATIVPVGAALGWPAEMAAAVRTTLLAMARNELRRDAWSAETVALCGASVIGPAMAHLGAQLEARRPGEAYPYYTEEVLDHWRRRDAAWWAALPAEVWPDLLRSRNAEMRTLALTHVAVAASQTRPASKRRPAPPTP